jgi:hypothetical protein
MSNPNSNPTRHLCTYALSLALCAGSVGALAQSDNFNDGNDNGWTHYDPLYIPPLNLGPQTSFICADGTYRIKGSATPDIMQLGPGRGGSFITTATYTNFYVSADVVSWDTNVHQIFGVCARISDIGLQSTKGYLFDLDTSRPTGGDLDIARIDNEAGTTIESGGGVVTLTPGASYRFVFLGEGPEMHAFLFHLPDTVIPIAHVWATDAGYESGYSGLLVADEPNTSPMDIVAPDATFDNYYAANVIPPPAMRVTADSSAQTMAVSWAPYPGFVLESTPSLEGTPVWTEESPTSISNTNLMFETSNATGNKFFRLKKPL